MTDQNLPASVERSTEDPQSFLDRTVRNLRDLWHNIASGAPAKEQTLGDGDTNRLREQMSACLEARAGEVAARAHAAALGHEYLGLTAEGRQVFLGLLADDFARDESLVAEAATAYSNAATDSDIDRAARDLKRALVAPREQLLTQFNALPEGVKFLVDMRAELLALAAETPRYRGVLDDLTGLLRGWFDIGFLELRRITWDAPASLLEKLIAYEAVHEVSSWTDLKHRLAGDRRCFAYFHPGMPEEPLIFVQVALVSGMSDDVAVLLDPTEPSLDPHKANTAVFYSISNAQDGLSGISFGNFLIKRVVSLLALEFPKLKTFATLSPVPGFMTWFQAQPAGTLVTEAEAKSLAGGSGAEAHPANLLDQQAWKNDAGIEKELKSISTRALAKYLAHAKRTGGTALDPVAHFHLSNGARLERINWMADASPKGMSQSAGMMVNYLYDPNVIDRNHEAYAEQGKVSMSSAIRALAKKNPTETSTAT